MNTDYEQPLGGYSTYLLSAQRIQCGGAEVYDRGRSFSLGLSIDF